MAEILTNLKKFKEIYNAGNLLFYVGFYEEFNDASCQTFPLGQKKLWTEAYVLLKIKFFMDSVLSLGVLQ